MTVYFTGEGISVNPVPTGDAAPPTPLSFPSFPYTATNGGQPPTVYFMGFMPGFVGLGQANIVVPDLAPGTYPITLTVNNVMSNAPLITVE